MGFPRDEFLTLLTGLFPNGATIRWKGAPESFANPIGHGTPIVVTLSTSRAKARGEERRRTFDATKNAYALIIRFLYRWSVTIDVETYNSDERAEDILLAVCHRMRWLSSITGFEGMGLATVDYGDVIPSIRPDINQDHECFGAVCEWLFAQTEVSTETDGDSGYVIETITSIQGTVTGGVPDPLTVNVP